MLNSRNERELCFVVRIDAVEPIPGRDRVESAIIGGWTVMTRINQFKPGDLGIYFEIDSQVQAKEPFLFLESKHYKIKTQKYKTPEGHFWSQGLLMHPSDFGWTINSSRDCVIDKNNVVHCVNNESRFLTKELGVTYAEAEDNIRKAKSVDKYKKMANRHQRIFKKPLVRWLMKRGWGKKLMFLFFGKKKDKRNAWPSHIAAKTDVERVQNMIYVLNNKKSYVASEKIDGSSFSVMAERTWLGKIKQYVCSRNVVFKTPSDKCYYEKNIYFEAYEKYNFKEKIVQIMNDLHLDNIAIQMEIFGPDVQKRTYSLAEREVRVFHIVSNGVKFPMDKTVEICETYDIPHVPIIDDNYILPDSLKELQKFVESEGSKIDGGMKEGIVFYDKETGQQYFKFVSPEFLMKYHQ